ncbi:chromosome segregation protein SMC [Halioxenophilus sp. WMMB6]|uniref:chromosome segregation protein SMC n=1 Tax=Halioxenophilus sp. WMMB6 TaxID=3073815 RepID=UPI00295E5360|nr:chromosome segregation protein SMC [Halioxenophilus sp. WMMB6]
MRLKCIKLAGFKSFVDPTTVYFPSNLCAVVGPNGCGKSNIIDAVRWVMGESSAKNLRGESMTDVIFNGSGSRKPIGQASIELVFDNSDGTIVGEYASYSEISVKRKVTRDGQNNYYLNGNRCRRRDITDIFLGTGLGPRSYAIIEQGMISRLIEAKPEELRIYIEEAAGISKYKERRRDTENRMRRTQENLERLTDIREELDRQLSRLERQAQAAEKYTEFKQQERQLKAWLQALRYKVLDEQASLKAAEITELELKVESFVTEHVSTDTQIERLRNQHAEAGETFNEVQGRFYSLGNDIARIEQNIHHSQERTRQLQVDLEAAEREYKESQELLQLDSERAETIAAELLEVEPELEMLQVAEEDSSEGLLDAEERMRQWQTRWDEFNQAAAEPRHAAEVQQSRIQHLEQVQSRLNQRIERLRDEKSNLTAGEGEDNLAILKEQQAELEITGEQLREQSDSSNDLLLAKQQRIEELRNQLDDVRSRLQTQKGRLASLEALQQAALSEQSDVVEAWLDEHQLKQLPKLAEQIQVRDGWDVAVETVLGSDLQAIAVDQFDQLAQTLTGLNQGNLTLLDSSRQVSASTSGASLVEFVSGSSAVASLLAGVLVAEDVTQALSLRGQLQAHESVITRDGLWFGPGWVRARKEQNAAAGVLARQQELELLTAKLEEDQVQAEQLSAELESTLAQQKDLQNQREDIRRQLDQYNRQFSELSAQVSAQQVQIEQILVRRTRVEQEINEALQQQSQEAKNLTEARAILGDAIEAMEDDSGKRDALLAERDAIRQTLDNARVKAREDKDRAHQLAIQCQSLKTQLESIRASLVRTEQQHARAQERRGNLLQSLEQNQDPAEDQKSELEALLQKRLSVEGELNTARSAVQAVEHGLRELEQGRSKIEQQTNEVRAVLESARLSARELQTKRQNTLDLLQEEDFQLADVLAELDPSESEQSLTGKISGLEDKISRLGAINLAAIDEFKTESERKNYLDRQDADLRDALDMLENAIRKIDRETRTRFKETFDQVNSGLQELFPKVFGGGHAYLELTGEDLLDTGIAIMARPPGKRNSTIHLLSGGEKALTAIALVFSIFRLNPAPFCMLDEVDAPLDDANVGRYARMVEEMSAHVQFIYITHNKGAMEMAQNLLGVTMHEPGVSRLVTVDVEEAAELAAS